MTYIREDQADISVSVMDPSGAWVPFFENWYSVEGGNLESDDGKTRPGGMGDEVSLGGPSSRGDVTVRIQQTDTVIAHHATLETRVIEDAPVKVGYQFLNRLKQPYDTTHTVMGTMKSAALADMDGGSSDAAFYTIVVSSNERAAS